MSKSFRLSLVLTLLAFAGVAERAMAQTLSQDLQAAYIFNFAKYIKWPSDTAAFVIGVYGKPETTTILDKAFAQRKIAGRRTETRMVATADEILACNIIYLPESESSHLKHLTNITRGRKVLIVTEADLIKKGAFISFVVIDDKLKFKLKQSALAEAGLSASEGLLKLAILE